MDFFPYELRRNQDAIISTIRNTLERNGDLVFESGTGSGKTICTISSTLKYAFEHNKKIVYTTRTNAQQRQVVIELREIRKRYGGDKERFFGVGVQGRNNMCILARNNSDLSGGTSEELSRFCSNMKKKARFGKNKKETGCVYFSCFLRDKDKVSKTVDWFKDNLPTAEEFIDYCEKKQVCPYEVNKLLIREASLVVVPYIYVFDLMIRNMLFDWLSIPVSDIILVVDEAHNLPDYLRDLFSAQLSSWMLKSCMFEADKYGDPSILDGRNTISGFCKILSNIISEIRDTYVYGVMEDGIRRKEFEKLDAFIPSHEFQTEIMSRLKVNSKTLHDIVGDLVAYGEKIQEYRQREGKLPRSYLHKLGVFLDFWLSLEMDQYAKLVVDSGDGSNPRIEAFCLDPSIGAKIIRDFHSSIHMSGTLEPLEEYRDSLGLLHSTELVSYPSPFPEKNRLVLYIKDVTTKYDEIVKDESIPRRMISYITDVCNSFPLNTMVFFPSFDSLSGFLRKGLRSDINRCIYVEEQGISQFELMDLVNDFKKSSNSENCAAMFSVMGGRISEGMDFPAEELEIAIIVGIPYPKPTARQRGLQRYYDIKFGKGWEYTVNAPTARKLLQSIGRLIRDEKDRGVAIILDRRAARFKQYIRDLKPSDSLLDEIHSFMKCK